MITPELLEFIKRKLQEGAKPSDIVASLSSRGWKDSHIEAAFNQLGYKTKAVGSGSASQAAALPSDSRVYPTINISRIANSKRWWAIPLFGGLAKVIILIPVYFVIFFFALVAGSASTINSFVVLFKGKYWMPAYKQNLGLMRMLAKTYFFFMGLTDKYPGFSRDIKDSFSLDINYPENPNKLYAIPVLGILLRIVVLFPFILYSEILGYATTIGVFIFSSLTVLFRGKYPESVYELAVDSRRINFAAQAYMAGLSDRYPSFRISMNHKDIKIALLVVGALLVLVPALSNPQNSRSRNLNYQNPVGLENQQPLNIQLASESYIDKENGFKITPPEGWKTETSPMGQLVPRVRFYAENSIAYLTVSVEPTHGLSFDAYIKAGKEGLTQLKAYELIKESETAIGNKRVYVFEGIIQGGGEKIRLAQYILVGDSNAYIISAGTNDSEWHNYKDLFETSLATFSTLP